MRDAIQSSIAYKALTRIGTIYKLERALKNLSSEEQFKERQASIKPLVEEYFAWVKEILAQKTALPKGETAKGLNYSINQEEYLKVFLSDGEVPIDNSASERSLRNFAIGRANNLNVYYYVEHLLSELPQLVDENGNIEQLLLEPVMPWSRSLPADCYSKRRK